MVSANEICRFAVVKKIRKKMVHLCDIITKMKMSNKNGNLSTVTYLRLKCLLTFVVMDSFSFITSLKANAIFLLKYII